MVSSIKFRKCFAKFMIPIALLQFTGAALNAAKKLQVNIQLGKIDHIS